MTKQNIDIKDYDLFLESIKACAKIVDSAKFIINPTGLHIFGARQSARSRCEIETNSIYAENEISFSIENVSMFLKILMSAKDIHEGDYSRMKMMLDRSFFRIESNRFKTKYSTCDENIIAMWVSKKLEVPMTPIFEFTSTSDFIKRINGHAFMFSDPKQVRVYLETRSDMENNAIFATLGNRETELNNDITLKFGLVTAGSLEIKNEAGLITGERHIIIDLERMNMFNAIQSNNIKFQFMNMNCLVSRTELRGKNNSILNMTIYGTILKN